MGSWWNYWCGLGGLLGGPLGGPLGGLLVDFLVDSWWTSWWTLGGLLGVVLAYIASMLHAHNINIYVANFGISISWTSKTFILNPIFITNITKKGF